MVAPVYAAGAFGNDNVAAAAAELDACGFLRVAEKRLSMVRNLRYIFQRARLSAQEVRTLRSVVVGLVAFGGGRSGNDDGGGG